MLIKFAVLKIFLFKWKVELMRCIPLNTNICITCKVFDSNPKVIKFTVLKIFGLFKVVFWTDEMYSSVSHAPIDTTAVTWRWDLCIIWCNIWAYSQLSKQLSYPASLFLLLWKLLVQKYSNYSFILESLWFKSKVDRIYWLYWRFSYLWEVFFR